MGVTNRRAVVGAIFVCLASACATSRAVPASSGAEASAPTLTPPGPAQSSLVLAATTEAMHGVYNVARGESTSILQLAQEIVRVSGSRSEIRFRDNGQLLSICQRIVSQVGRRVDESSPICDARLPDGSRVNVIAPPLAIDGPALTIRKFKKDKLNLDQLVRFGAKIHLNGQTATTVTWDNRDNISNDGNMFGLVFRQERNPDGSLINRNFDQGVVQYTIRGDMKAVATAASPGS